MVKRITVFILLALSIGLFSVMSISASPAQEFGSGWTASYYNNAQLTGSPVFTEVLPNGINFNWGVGSPNPAVPVDNFSARYGSVQNFSAGTYEFVVGSDDGVRVFIDGVLVLDRFIGRVFTIDRFQQTLTAGPHQITVEYMELVDQAVAYLREGFANINNPKGLLIALAATIFLGSWKQWIPVSLVAVIVLVTLVNLYRGIEAASAPADPVYAGQAQSILRGWLLRQLPALILVPLYTAWYLNRAPARAFYRRSPTSHPAATARSGATPNRLKHPE